MITKACPENLEEVRNQTFCVHESFLAVGFYIPELQNIFSAEFCKSQVHHLLIVSSFQGREGKGHSRSGKQVGMSSRFSAELSFWMKQWLPHTQRVTWFVSHITISLGSGGVGRHQSSPRAAPLCLQSHKSQNHWGWKTPPRVSNLSRAPSATSFATSRHGDPAANLNICPNV